MRKIKQLSILIIISVFLNGCGNDNFFKVDVDNIQEVDVEIKRFEKRMFEIDKAQFITNIEAYQNEFPTLLNGDITDTFDLNRVWSFFEDPYKQELYQLAVNDYPDLSGVEEELKGVFRHMFYYFPSWNIPDVYTYVSGLDFQRPVKYSGRDVIIALDVYLPSAREIYAQSRIPKYRLRRMQEERISADVSQQIAIAFVPPTSTTPRLIDQMIYEGKILYFVNAMQPLIMDTVLFNYSPNQMNWCKTNEAKVWAFMMESDFLFETKVPILKKFLEDGPFTSLFNKQSPARIGAYIGYQIVLNYMKENNVTLEEMLMEEDYQLILQQSGYHPE